ncbi:DUF4838 domain-containing protein [Rubripirellula sp.]|nr:DUF4838 domain-containing protein [Rubripirellula sp.]MDB4634151.1 DUF4838 domain-containing protein [Rubripirellula sp.]
MAQEMILKQILIVAVASVGCLFTMQTDADGALIVQEGKAQAEIVISEMAPRSTRLAAAELQTYVEKISGALLPIRNEPSAAVSVQIYVGESRHVKELGVTAEGLEHGAYRVLSGENWLALVGDDTDFTPIEPWAKNNSGRAEKLQSEWEKASGLSLGVPNGGLYKFRQRMPAKLAKEEREYLWQYDERGSLNAVCGFLRSLGVRWYLPGELGEVVPHILTIPLPIVDQTVRPDFEVRQFNVRFATVDEELMRWSMRLGIRHPYGQMIAHGLDTMTHPDILKQQHPEWFALYGGKRDTQVGKRLNHLCYSNPELFDATVKWARAQFDVYDYQSVSIMPPDAYIAICQCKLCAGKQMDDMGARGKLSNHVWDFVNRVAREVGKTHPSKKIVCCAYGANTNPPSNIKQLEPNVEVVIVGGRRPRNSLPEQRMPIQALRSGWQEITDQSILVFENYPFTARRSYLPAFVARTIGDSINATKGFSRGEDIWLSFPRVHDDPNIGFNHFQVYFTARMWWGGTQAEVETLLDEYCRLFYGPAGPDMKSFFDYCEANYQAMESDKQKIDKALEIFSAAKASVLPGSNHAKRLELIDQYLDALRSKGIQLQQKRGKVTKLRTVREPKAPIVIDGKLDEPYWRDCLSASTGSLRELQTGSQPIFGTTVKVGWDRAGQALYFGIRCEDQVGDPLNSTTTKNEDEAIWYGDALEIELDTDAHSYYQIVVNPAGALVDLDRAAGKNSRLRWDSQAEVATHIAEDHWNVEIRIPVTDDENDPLNQVIGRKPSQSLPWHFNVCRQRIRENGSEYSAFSPTGTAGFHLPMKFAHLYDGASHTFEVDPTVSDFLSEYTAANQLMKRQQYDQALAAFVELSKNGMATDYQKSVALSKAAHCARRKKKIEQAAAFVHLVPLEAIAMTVHMQNLIAERQWAALIDQFGNSDLLDLPFTQIGAAAFARGQAHYTLKSGAKADADLRLALKFTSDTRMRMSILRTMGQNRELVLQNDALAMEAFRKIVDSKTNTGSAEFFTGLQGVARLLSRGGDHREALDVFNRVDINTLAGSWRPSMRLSHGQTLEAAGRKAEAIQAYRLVLSDERASESHRRRAKDAITALQGGD